jgi:hypothetical protein
MDAVAPIHTLVTQAPSQSHARTMRLGSALLAPIGLFFGFAGVLYVVPPLLALAGFSLLWGYHRLAAGQTLPVSPVLFWSLSALFNLGGLVTLAAFVARENVTVTTTLWLLWLVSATVLSARAALAELR